MFFNVVGYKNFVNKIADLDFNEMEFIGCLQLIKKKQFNYLEHRFITWNQGITKIVYASHL